MDTRVQDPDTVLDCIVDWAAGWQPTQDASVAAADAFADTLACIIAGANDPACRAFSSLARSGAGALLDVLDDGTPPSTAALLLGTAAHALDFDDSGTEVLGHSSAVLVPALLPMATAENLPGTTLAAAFAVGLEVQERLGRMANPDHYARGWHSTSTLCAMGAAAACARLVGLDAGGIRAAISNCFSMIGGSKRQFGTPMKPIHAGLAARNAVEAALLARAGVSGNPNILSSAWGFFDLYSSPPSPAIAASAASGLDGATALERGTLNTKRFPSCAATHRTLDGILEILERHVQDREQISAVETWVPAPLAANLRFDRPATEMEARFSMPYCVTHLIRSRQLCLADFTPEAVQTARTHAVPTVGMHAIDADPHAVAVETRVTLRSGASFKTSVLAPRGSGANPLDRTERAAKFTDCWAFGGAAGNAGTGHALALALVEQPLVRRTACALGAEVKGCSTTEYREGS